MTDLDILRKFNQIILYGPPGTGKTHAAKELAQAALWLDNDGMRENQGEWWDIVQFHPAYNYEDFVRGITVRNDKNGQVHYKAENKIFAKMCEVATAGMGNPYALIIDEINRANISAVLGELIYALEYRGKPVNTPYTVNGNSQLTIPENLYVIGTMNTADRTIGQIDYAVRRRFAFIQKLPDREVITDEKAKAVFDKINGLFAGTLLSSGYDKEDVAIGHSYFLDKNWPINVQCKALPILREYVKDGVLMEGAKEQINKIDEKLSAEIREMLNDNMPVLEMRGYALVPREASRGHVLRWRKGDVTSEKNHLRGTVRGIVEHYIADNGIRTIKQLASVFPKSVNGCRFVKKLINENNLNAERKINGRNRYFNSYLTLGNGTKILLCDQWGISGRQHGRGWADFARTIKELGYEIENSSGKSILPRE